MAESSANTTLAVEADAIKQDNIERTYFRAGTGYAASARVKLTTKYSVDIQNGSTYGRMWKECSLPKYPPF